MNLIKVITAETPQELQAELNALLVTIDLYEIQNNVTTVGGKPQFIEYVYGREKEA